MADLKIKITGTLDSKQSKTEINSKIKELEGQLDKVNLKIVIDDKVTKTLSDLSKAMENHKKIAQDLNRVMKEEKTIIKEVDGSIKEKIRQHLKSGEIVEKEIEKINKKNKAMQDEQEEIGQLISDYQKLGQIQKEITRQNGKGNTTGTTEKYRSDYTDTVYKSNKNGNVTSVTTTQNYDQQRKAIDQLNTKLNELRQTGELSERTLSILGNSINSAKSVSEIEKIRARLNLLDSAVQSREKTKELEKQLDLYRRQAEIQVNALRNNPNKIISNSQNTQLTNYLNNVTALNARTPDLQNRMRQLALDFREVSTQTLTAGRNTLTWGQAFSTAMQKFPIWMAASTAFFQTFNFFKDGIAYVNELNKALTEIAIVTGKSQTEVEQLGVEYQKLAYTMGVLTTDIASATKEFYRQGLSQEEVMQRAQVATEYAKISALDFKSSAEILTATVNSMGISIERASDVFSYLGDATATSSSEIGQAFQRVGGSASAINLEFEKVASWIAVLSARTREGAGTIGNSIKSIIARVQNLRENGFDEEDGTQINDVAKALDSVGVALVDKSGEFRNFGTVMDELGGRWQKLDTRQKAYVATTVAGTYQQSKFLNLMEGYSDTIPLYQKSLEAAGTTQQKFNQYQQSTEATLNRLKDTWTSVWQSSFQSDTIRQVVNLLDLLAKGFKATIDTIGFLPTLIGLGSTAFIALNGSMRNSIMSTGMLSSSLVRAGDSMLIATGASRGLQVSLYNTTLAARATAGAFSVMGTALKATFTFLSRAILPIAGFMALGFAISKVTEAIQKQSEESKKMKQEQDDIVKKYSSNADQVNRLSGEYENLSEKVKNGKLDKNSAEYVDNMNELGKLMPSLVQSTDEHGNSILRSVDAVKQELDYAKQLKENYAQMTVANFEKDLDTQASKVEEILQKIENYKKNANGSDQSGLVRAKGIVSVDEGAKLYDQRQIIAQERELQLLLADSGKYMTDKAKAILDVQGVTSKLSDTSNKLVESYINEAVASKKTVKDGEDFKQFLSDTTNKAVDFATVLSNIPDTLVNLFSVSDIDNFSKNQIGVMESISESVRSGYTDWEQYRVALEKVGFTNVDQIIDALTNKVQENTTSVYDNVLSLEQINKKLESAKGNFSALKDVIMDMVRAKQIDQAVTTMQGEAYNALSDELSPINDLLEKMAEGKQISAAEAMDLISKEKELAGAISIENGQVKINEKAVIDLRDAKVASYKDMMKSVQQEAINTANATISKLNGYKLEIKAIGSVAEAKQRLAEIDAQRNIANSGMGDWNTRDELNNAHEAVQGILDLQKDLDGLSDMATTGLTQVGTSLEKLSDQKEKDKKETENSIYVSNEYLKALEKINAEIEKYQAIMKQFPDYSKEYRDALKKEIDLLGKKQKLIEDQAKTLEQQIKSGNVQQYGIITTKSSSPSTSTGATSYAETPSYSSSSSAGTYGGKYASYVNQAAAKYGVDPFLVAAIIQNESGFNPGAHSPAGAMGLMQLMPGTASSMGVSNAYDPYQNIMGGTKYLANIIKQYNGNVEKALAGYNWGPNRQAIRDGNTSAYPTETLNYVKKVLASYKDLSGSIVKSVDNATQSVADYYLNNFRISSKFNEKRGSENHKGLDLANGRAGDPVKALKGGKVITAAYSKSAGYWVVVQQDDGIVAKYMHMQKGSLNVKAGQTIQAGQQLGKVGSTGDSTGNHLHLQLESGGKAIDPEKYLRNMDSQVSYSSTSSSADDASEASKQAAEAAQNIDQAKSDLLQLQQDAADTAAQIKELEFELINSEIAGFDHTSSQLNNQIEYDKKRMELWADSFVYQKAMISDQAIQYQKLMDNIDKERGYILDQIANGKLDAAQKEELRNKLADLNSEYIDYQINLKNTNTELVDLLKAQKDKINEESDAFIEAYKAFYEKKRDIDQKAYDDQMALIDKQENERDYNKDLKERQKGIEELKQQIASLSMDDSQKSKVADLQDQLTKQQGDLGEFTHDKEIEDRKSNLEKQKELNAQYYDDLLNDERNFAKMKEDILAGNIQKYQDMMGDWKDTVLANLDEIGKSIGNNLIDQLTNATKGLEDAKGQVSDLTMVYRGTKEDVSGKDTKKVDQVTILSDVPLLKKTENGYELSGTILKKGQKYKAYGVNDKDGVYNIGGGFVSADPTVSKYQRFLSGGLIYSSQ